VIENEKLECGLSWTSQHHLTVKEISKLEGYMKIFLHNDIYSARIRIEFFGIIRYAENNFLSNEKLFIVDFERINQYLTRRIICCHSDIARPCSLAIGKQRLIKYILII
jgi:hypothetical protein